MAYNYAVLGSGRQGTATAYDLAVHGDADLILLADIDVSQAERAAARVNKLAGRPVCKVASLNAKDEAAVTRLLKDSKINATISGVPYFFNLSLSRACIQAGSSMCDYGGNTDVVLKQLDLNGDAQKAGVAIVPDCGMAPGLGNSLVAYTMSLLDQCRDVIMYDGGLPQDPKPPWNYRLFFSIEGLTNEYFGRANWLNDGKHFQPECFEEYERVAFPAPFGELEAFTTAGATSTMPWSYFGKLRTLTNKTLRWPGHFAQWKNFQNAGLFALEPVEVDGQRVIPRHVFHALIEPQIRAQEGDKDVVLIRIITRGLKDGKETEITLDLIDYFDEKTGFSAMERATGFHAAIMAYLAASGRTPKGAIPVELAVEPDIFMSELKKRDFNLKQTVAPMPALAKA